MTTALAVGTAIGNTIALVSKYLVSASALLFDGLYYSLSQIQSATINTLKFLLSTIKNVFQGGVYTLKLLTRTVKRLGLSMKKSIANTRAKLRVSFAMAAAKFAIKGIIVGAKFSIFLFTVKSKTNTYFGAIKHLVSRATNIVARKISPYSSVITRKLSRYRQTIAAKLSVYTHVITDPLRIMAGAIIRTSKSTDITGSPTSKSSGMPLKGITLPEAMPQSISLPEATTGSYEVSGHHNTTS